MPPIRNEGRYDPLPYKYFGYPKVARNMLEMKNSRGNSSEANPVAERILRPRYLCLLREEGQSAMIINVDHWMASNKAGEHLSYVFVAYTGEQFSTTEDLRTLHAIADAAARNAGVQAYWVGCSCMPDPEDLQDDVSLRSWLLTHSLTIHRSTESVMLSEERTLWPLQSALVLAQPTPAAIPTLCFANGVSVFGLSLRSCSHLPGRTSKSMLRVAI